MGKHHSRGSTENSGVATTFQTTYSRFRSDVAGVALVVRQPELAAGEGARFLHDLQALLQLAGLVGILDHVGDGLARIDDLQLAARRLHHVAARQGEARQAQGGGTKLG
jgi:hypothetical protein